jgi:tRNA (adenine22-N1)-methyltransferase
MTPRLLAIAGHVPQGLRVADIGADHAKLAMWLARHKGCKCIATDKNPNPLNAAKVRIETYGNTNGIIFRLGDGLSCISRDEVDVIIIAGMGGETISGILKPWAKDKLCILQPNTHSDRLKAFLIETGFNITGEEAVSERRREYTIIVCGGGY